MKTESKIHDCHHSLHRQKRNGTNAAIATKIGSNIEVSSEYGFTILGCSRFFFGLVLLVLGGTLDGSSFSIGFSSTSSSSPSLPANGASFGTSVKREIPY